MKKWKYYIIFTLILVAVLFVLKEHFNFYAFHREYNGIERVLSLFYLPVVLFIAAIFDLIQLISNTIIKGNLALTLFYLISIPVSFLYSIALSKAFLVTKKAFKHVVKKT